jgi:hypothetical protein
MARGFESKDVEYQQAEAIARGSSSRPVALNAAEREALDRRRRLQLSLTCMRADLAKATHPAHRASIEAAIQALEADLAGAP